MGFVGCLGGHDFYSEWNGKAWQGLTQSSLGLQRLLWLLCWEEITEEPEMDQKDCQETSTGTRWDVMGTWTIAGEEVRSVQTRMYFEDGASRIFLYWTWVERKLSMQDWTLVFNLNIWCLLHEDDGESCGWNSFGDLYLSRLTCQLDVWVSSRQLDYTSEAFGREVWARNINHSHEYLTTSDSSRLQWGILLKAIIGRALRNLYKVRTFNIYKLSQVKKIFVNSESNNQMDIICFINIMGWTVSPQNSAIEVLTPSILACDCVWKWGL